MDTVYFCDTDDSIKIGFSSTHKQRLADHRKYGLTLRAIVPGTSDDEKCIHRHFSKYKKGNGYGIEFFDPADEIYEYIDKLLSSGIACSNENDVENYPALSYSVVWAPNSINTKRLDNNGQMALWDHKSAKERVRYLSDFAYLSSITDEWYTPREPVEMARIVMGEIDLDPATTPQVNRKWIRARAFYTRETNGLAEDRQWKGRIWLNPPYGRGDNSASSFAEKLMKEISFGRVQQAITCLNVNSITSRWFLSTIMNLCCLHCLVHGRLQFIPPSGVTSGSSPTKGTVISYYGQNRNKFINTFKTIGTIITVV